MPPKVTPEKYQEMLQAYLEKPMASYVVQKCHVSNTTARKYIEKGNPRRGQKPLRRCLQQAMKRASTKIAYDYADSITKTQKASIAYREKLLARITGLKPKEIQARTLAKELDTLVRMEAFLAGVPDSRTEVVSQTDIHVIIELVRDMLGPEQALELSRRIEARLNPDATIPEQSSGEEGPGEDSLGSEEDSGPGDDPEVPE